MKKEIDLDEFVKKYLCGNKGNRGLSLFEWFMKRQGYLDIKELFVFTHREKGEIIEEKRDQTAVDIVDFMGSSYYLIEKFEAYYDKLGRSVIDVGDVFSGIHIGYLAMQEGVHLYEWKLQNPQSKEKSKTQTKECRSGDKGMPGEPGIPILPKHDAKLFVFSCSSNGKLIYSKGGKSFRDIVCFIEKKYHYNPRFDAYFNDEDDLMCYWNDIVDGIETGFFAIQDGNKLFKWRLQEYNYQFVNVKK